jgi:alpha-galactosidase
MIEFSWGNEAIRLTFYAEPGGPVRLVSVVEGPAGPDPVGVRAAQPLVEILSADLGHAHMSGRYVGTAAGAGLRYVRHAESSEDRGKRLEIQQSDGQTGLTALSVFEVGAGLAAVRTTTTVWSSQQPVRIWSVTSFATGAVVSGDAQDVLVWEGRTSWSAEHRWRSCALRGDGLTAVLQGGAPVTTLLTHRVTSVGTWSSGQWVPAGAVQDRRTGRALAWQIEHNGAWHWEVGEKPTWEQSLTSPPPVGSLTTQGPPSGAVRDGIYVAVLGPTEPHHQWSVSVDRDHRFTTVPVTFTAAATVEEAWGQLTRYRRATRRVHRQNSELPVVFNDYMNTLNGDPTEAKLRPLIAAAGQVGAEIFCIDAGWYDDTAGWWSSVGDWYPSSTRFPTGFVATLDHIRDQGMVPGLWLEPEVVGISSRAAAELPAQAFLRRDGIRIREHNRYLLDLRDPAARTHLGATIDRLITDYGIGYFKLDYNVVPGPGADGAAGSPGHNLLEHNKALISWLESVLDRHPDLVLENCASGAMRSDFAMLRVLQLQSTSDQQNPLLNPAIVVGALAHILPEQAANWAYPQPEMTDEMIVHTICSGLAGRLYQSGLLHHLSHDQLALVRHGIAVHKQIRHAIARSVPRFPTGLPSWDDGWTTVAFDSDPDTYLIAWRQEHADTTLNIPLHHLHGRTLLIEQLYPARHIGSPWSIERTSAGVTITTTDRSPAARVYRLSPR